MPQESKLKAIVTARSGETLIDELIVISWSKNERLRRALKIGGIGLAAAIAFVFLPILHFVLVPGALIATPILVWLTMKQSQVISRQFIACPKCTTKVEFPQTAKLESTQVLCDQCRSVLDVKAA